MESAPTRNVVVFDLETQRTFQEVGGRHNLHRLGLARDEQVDAWVRRDAYGSLKRLVGGAAD